MKKIESIKELRKICQPEYKQVKVNPFYRIYRRFFRIFSIYITRFLIYLHVSANLVSILGLILGIFGGVYFYLGKFLLGSIIMQLWFFMDTLDGELARYYYKKGKKNNYLVKGEFLDLNSHHLVHSLTFIGLSFGLYNLSNNLWMIYLGISSLFALLLNELIDLNRIKVLYSQKITYKRINLKDYKKNIFKKILLIYTFPSIINIIFIASLFDFVNYLLYFYGITFPIIVLVKFVVNNFVKKW